MPPLPWFKYYPNEFFNDRHVARMTLEEIGLYHLMLRCAWNEEPPGSLPADIYELAKLLGLRPQIVRRLLLGTLGKCWKTLLKLPSNLGETNQFHQSFSEVLKCKTVQFNPTFPDRIYNPRLVEEAHKQTVKSAKARRSVSNRWHTNVYPDDYTNVLPYKSKSKSKSKELYIDSLDSKDSKILDSKKSKVLKSDLMAWIDVFNEITGSSYRGSKSHLAQIKARIANGFTLKDCQSVVRAKHKQWRDDPQMAQYIRPETLFSTKFETYLQQSKNGLGESYLDRLMREKGLSDAKE